MTAAGLLALGLLGLAAPAARWHVDARSPGPSADGSEARPFATLAQALARAGSGDEVAVAPGVYRERLVVDRPLSLHGGSGVVLRPPEPTGEVVRLDAPATLEGLRVEGGDVGLRVRAPAALRDLAFDEAQQSAIVVERGLTRLASTRIRVSATSEARVVANHRFGIRVDAGAHLVAEDVRFEGPLRFAVRSEGAAALDRLSVHGAIGGVACLEGCTAAVTRSSFDGGGEVGLLAGGGSRLTARDCLVTRYETGVAANPGSTVRLEDTMTAFCHHTGIAALKAELVAIGHVHLGRAGIAGIQLIESRAQLLGGVVLDPGTSGILVRLGSTVARGVSVRGAALDAQGSLGDGIFALQPEQLLLVGARLEENAGAGLSVLGGRAEVEGLEASRNGIAGVVAQHAARLQVRGSRIRGNGGPGVVAIEGSTVEVATSRLDSNVDGPTQVDCDSRAQIFLPAESLGEAPVPACSLPALQ